MITSLSVSMDITPPKWACQANSSSVKFRREERAARTMGVACVHLYDCNTKTNLQKVI